MKSDRLSYLESCRRLHDLGLEGAEPPPMPERMPSYADEDLLGVEFFRTEVSDADCSNLTLPRTFFGRSEIRNVRFCNADLTESRMCWNDFIDVDFTKATLVGCDLRGSAYSSVNFSGAALQGADLRRSSFENCIFTDALMDGAILFRGQEIDPVLSETQTAAIDWRDEEGPFPDGG
jgi:BTB/POZ domain-containing protein KCTD9